MERMAAPPSWTCGKKRRIYCVTWNTCRMNIVGTIHTLYCMNMHHARHAHQRKVHDIDAQHKMLDAFVAQEVPLTEPDAIERQPHLHDFVIHTHTWLRRILLGHTHSERAGNAGAKRHAHQQVV